MCVFPAESTRHLARFGCPTAALPGADVDVVQDERWKIWNFKLVCSNESSSVRASIFEIEHNRKIPQRKNEKNGLDNVRIILRAERSRRKTNSLNPGPVGGIIVDRWIHFILFYF